MKEELAMISGRTTRAGLGETWLTGGHVPTRRWVRGGLRLL